MLCCHIKLEEMIFQLRLLPFSSTSWEKLLTNRQRGISHNIWSKTFSPVFVRSVLYHQVRSQATTASIGGKEGNPCNGICKGLAMCTHSQCLQLLRLVCSRKGSFKCWCIQPLATSCDSQGSTSARRFTEQNPLLSRVQGLSLKVGLRKLILPWRVIIPKPGRAQILALLHDDHSGISKMKGLARSYVWWPNIDADLEAQVKQCNQCQLNCPSQPAVPCTHGNGQTTYGIVFMLTMPGLLWVRCLW